MHYHWVLKLITKIGIILRFWSPPTFRTWFWMIFVDFLQIFWMWLCMLSMMTTDGEVQVKFLQAAGVGIGCPLQSLEVSFAFKSTSLCWIADSKQWLVWGHTNYINIFNPSHITYLFTFAATVPVATSWRVSFTRSQTWADCRSPRTSIKSFTCFLDFWDFMTFWM